MIKFIISLSLNIKLNRSCFKLLYWRTLRTLNRKFFCLHRIFFPSLCTSKPHLKIIKKRTFEKVFFDYKNENSNLIPIHRTSSAEFDTFLLYLKFFEFLVSFDLQTNFSSYLKTLYLKCLLSSYFINFPSSNPNFSIVYIVT